MPAAVGGVAAEMFDTLAPEMSGFSRVALSNRWLFGPLVQSQLEKSASSNALLRTTTALTLMSAGNQDNVLPGRAEGIVNFRLLPGDSQASVVERVKRTIDDDRISVTAVTAIEPSNVSPADSRGYQAINRTVRELFPGTVVSPGLMLGTSDSRHFAALSQQVFRFSPIRAKPEDLARFHGTNERISLANLADLIRFYQRLLQTSAGASSSEGAKP